MMSLCSVVCLDSWDTRLGPVVSQSLFQSCAVSLSGLSNISRGDFGATCETVSGSEIWILVEWFDSTYMPRMFAYPSNTADRRFGLPTFEVEQAVSASAAFDPF